MTKTRQTLLLLALSLAGSYALAQQPGGPHGMNAQHDSSDDEHGMHHGMNSDHESGGGMHRGSMHCPMEDAGPLADVKIEKTATGAVIKLTAKKPEDVERIQHMAEMMAEHMSWSKDTKKPETPAAKPASTPSKTAPATAAPKTTK